VLSVLKSFVVLVDSLNEVIGRAVAWLTLGCVINCFIVVLLRYGFSIGYPWLQELYVWQHAAIFMIGAGYTLKHNGHVNVDVLYTRMTPRRKAWVDIIGTAVFLLPWVIVVALYAAPFVTSSWAVGEASSQSDGMPALYLLKSVIWVFCAVLGLQGLALMAKRILFLNGDPTWPPVDSAPESDEAFSHDAGGL